jgi:hypothetical protein
LSAACTGPRWQRVAGVRRRCKFQKAVRTVMFWRALRVTSACTSHATPAAARRCASQRAPSLWSSARLDGSTRPL